MSTLLTESNEPKECVGGISVLRFYAGDKRGMCFQFSTEKGTVVISAGTIEWACNQERR